MLRPRIIPCLLIKNNGLVKTIKFSDPKYLGDPINTVRIFNEKFVDELIVLDIDATNNSIEPNFELIKKLASECRMPLFYGGGIKNIEHFTKIISLGVEKISICTSAIEDEKLVTKASCAVGSQSVVVCLDIKKTIFNKYFLYTNCGTKKINSNPIEFAKKMVELGAGEILINFIDRDGTMDGYDFDFINQIKKKINTPLTVLGGAGSKDDISNLFYKFGNIGAGVGSLFVFKGKYRAVLINYPNNIEKEKILISTVYDN